MCPMAHVILGSPINSRSSFNCSIKLRNHTWGTAVIMALKGNLCHASEKLQIPRAIKTNQTNNRVAVFF